MAYNIKLEAFEGPLDLLLHLIKKNQVNIYDIPITMIADQYLEYLEVMKALNLNLAGEFLVLATTLLHIKSKMLLPTVEEEEEGEEQEDPRDELVERLLEYQRYKEVAQELSEREILGRDTFTGGMPPSEFSSCEKEGFRELTLFELIEAFAKVTKVTTHPKSIGISRERIHIHIKMKEIVEKLKKEESLVFQSLFQNTSIKEEIIVTFLAILELMRLKIIRVYQAVIHGTIKIYPGPGSGSKDLILSLDGMGPVGG